MAGEYQVTSIAIEAMGAATSRAQVSGFVGEALHTGDRATGAQLSSFALEVLRPVADRPRRRRESIAVA